MTQPSIWTNKHFAAVMAIFACILWGSAFPVLKVTYAELQLDAGDITSRMLLAGARFFLASMILFGFSKLNNQSSRLKLHVLPSILFLGLTQTGLQYFFFYNGIANSTGIKSAILNGFGNFLVVIVAHFIYKNDRLHLGKIIGLLTGFAGIVLINWQPNTTELTWNFTLFGEGFLLFAGIAGVIGTFQAKKLTTIMNPILINAYQLLFGSTVLIFLGLPVLWQKDLVFTPLFWILFVYSAFLSAAAFSIWYTLLKYHKAGEITMFRFTIPLAGTMLSAAFLPDESLSVLVLLSMLLVAFGIAIVNRWHNSS